MTVFAIETSCDETSAAVVRDGVVLSNLVASQAEVHREYGGVVPELAAREHLRNLVPLAEASFHRAHVSRSEVEAVAVTQGPGLPSALRAGFEMARGFAYAAGVKFIGIHHHEAHLYSPWIRPGPHSAEFDQFQPSVSLIASGGHTMLVAVEEELRHRVLGTTVDDAAGECFDKIGKLLGLAYPAGPEIERLAAGGNGRAFAFPRPMLTDGTDDFSFSGLKTAVRYFLEKNPRSITSAKGLADICASVQAAIVEVLATKTIRAARARGKRCVTGSGGVIANGALRGALSAACAEAGWTLRLAEKQFCTDNAAMIGILAERKFLLGQAVDSFESEVRPSWALDDSG